MKSFVVLLFLASLALASSSTLQSLSEYDWTQIKNPIKELAVLQNITVPVNEFRITGRIVGGSIASANQFPHQAALFIKANSGQQSFCGGSIISRTIILTAAHCVADNNRVLASEASVYVGLLNIQTGPYAWGMKVQRNQMKAHELYNPNGVRNDIGIIRLSSAVPIQANVQIIPLPTRAQTTLLVGESGTASGWGRASDQSTGSSSVLRFVTVPLISNSVCQNTFGATILSTNVCVSGAGGRGICQGDSGGPLVVTRNGRRVLAGISSFVAQLGCQKGYPSVFTKVGSYLDWLRVNANIAIL